MKRDSTLLNTISRTLFVVAVVGVASCATTGSAPPDWVGLVQDMSSEGVRIVAYGTGFDMIDARRAAGEDALSQIGQTLIMRLEEGGAVLDDEAGELIEEIARARLGTLDPVDRYVRSDGDAVELYRLYLYRILEIESDLADIYRVLPEAADLTTFSSGDGIDDVLPAIRELLERHVPASPTERTARLERVLALASRIVVVANPDRADVRLGEDLEGSITVRFLHNERSVIRDQRDLSVEVRGPVVDGERPIESFAIRTDPRGEATFSLPILDLAGVTTVVVQPAWLDDEVRRWQSALESQRDIDLLEAAVERLRGRTLISVTSRAAQTMTAVIVLDRDIAGNPINGADAMRGALQEFSDAGFRVRRVELDGVALERFAAMERITVADLYDVLPFDILSMVDRIVVGDARILEFSEEDGFTVSVSLEATTFDLRHDRVLARVALDERIAGSDARSAIRAAFQSAGRRMARRMVPRLP
ncbi:MAG: hypothetical protein MI724_16055 [Spirochaetales bacterium]|nr:hypothetical protein [Spirochaetales bacterium]